MCICAYKTRVTINQHLKTIYGTNNNHLFAHRHHHPAVRDYHFPRVAYATKEWRDRKKEWCHRPWGSSKSDPHWPCSATWHQPCRIALTEETRVKKHPWLTEIWIYKTTTHLIMNKCFYNSNTIYFFAIFFLEKYRDHYKYF